MSSTLRAVAVAGCTAILVTGAATSAGASSKPAFAVRPAFGQVGTTLTLTGADADFTHDTGATINGVAAADFVVVSAHRATAVVPKGATSGPVAVTGVPPLTGPNFVVQQATSGSSSLSRRRLTFSRPLVVSGTETAVGTRAPVAGQPAVLQHLVPGSKRWHNAKGTHIRKTDRHGTVQWTVTPSANGWYRIHFRETHAYAHVTTRSHGLRVLPRLHLRPIRTVPVLSRSQISGSIHPRLTGQVDLQEHVKGSWKTVRRAPIHAGHYSFDISPSALGKVTYRVVRSSDSLHGHSTSRTLRLQVVHRTLSFGNEGADVRALQKRLRSLHYDIGPVNGNYGWDTLHAVTAFEKVQGLSPDGETGMKVWQALNRPKHIHLRYPSAGSFAVEINIAKQVLLLAKNGHVWRILDTSTAGGYQFTGSGGQTETAITPTGHFTIQYKLTGWHKSDLGELYYPSYFTNTGYAIHGEGNGNSSGEVPPYPNSHGCVRITNDAVLRYFSKPWLAVGTSVWIYG
jgi:hypothetical protein